MNVNRPLSVAFLTQDFLGPRTHSINYYIARMIYELHTLNVLRNVYIISHKGESYVDRSLHDVMSDHDVSLYPKSIDAFTIDAVGAQSHPSLLHEVDIIICTMYWWGGALHKIYPLVDRPKIIYWVPSLVMHEFVTQRQIPWPGIELQVSLQKKALFSADHLIFNSRADLGRALTYYPKLSASKCNVIYPVSHPLHVCTDNTGCVNRNKDVIGYFGRWEARKGINFVVEAFCRRRIRNHNARLVVVSDYLDRELLDEFNVELCNKVERPDLIFAPACRMRLDYYTQFVRSI
jgi:glycosyltransferase involved in cell wall biosynthesis